MRYRAAVAGKILVIIGFAAAPLLIHASIATGRWTFVIVAIPLLQLLIVGIGAMTRRPESIKWLVAAAALFGSVALGAHEAGLSLVAMPGIPHALAYSALLVTFGASLLPGREALLTRLATAIHGPLPEELIAHTRRVTWAWCFFFAGQLLVSLMLFIFAPLEMWSFFVNVLNLPLVVAMFGVEYGYRLFRFRDYPHDIFSDIMGIFTKAGENGSRQTDSV